MRAELRDESNLRILERLKREHRIVVLAVRALLIFDILFALAADGAHMDLPVYVGGHRTVVVFHHFNRVILLLSLTIFV